MTRLQRKNVNKELSALARLNDRDINTSDIPEIEDWSSAIVGRFYKFAEQRNSPLLPKAGTFAGNIVGEGGSANIQSANATGITEVTSGELVKVCVKGMPEAWPEFIRRYHGLIASVVLRTSRRWGIQSAKYVEDLIQEVYVRLCADDYRLLKAYQGDYKSSFFGYLRVVATNVVYDQLRSLGSLNRGNEISGQVLLELNDVLATAVPKERELLVKEIDSILKTRASENERAIFWLYYRDGFSAAEIAAVLTSNLTVKGVESLLHSLVRRIMSELTKQNQRLS